MPIHNISRCSNTLYIWYGSGMQFTVVCSLNHDLTTILGLNHTPIFLKSNPTWHKSNSVRVDPYAHPQHIKVLKHFVYIWYGSGMQSTVVWSLNHDLTTSLQRNHTHFSWIPFSHAQWYGCGMHSIWVWSLNHDLTTSLGLNHHQFSYNPTPPDTRTTV